MDRNTFILAQIDRHGRGLEIGPSYNPVTPRSGGWNVETADHLDAEGLRQKYLAMNVDVSKVEDVDHVVGPSGIAATINKKGNFDWIIASHVIEHTPDMIRFLQDCEFLLRDGGILSLVIPDKRFCFDVFQPQSTTGQIWQAFRDKRTRHSAATIFDAHANSVSKGGALAWFLTTEGPYAPMSSLAEANAIAAAHEASEEYMDTHVWRFLPSSFKLIMQDLRSLGYTTFGISSFVAFPQFEFYVTLKKGHVAEQHDRIELLKAIQDEMLFVPEGKRGVEAETTTQIALSRVERFKKQWSHVKLLSHEIRSTPTGVRSRIRKLLD